MTPRRGTLLGLVLGWLAVVLVVGGLTFAVVSRAGSQVGQASAMRTVADAPVATSSGSRPTASASATSDPPSTRPTPQDSASSGPTPRPSATSTPPPAPTTRTRSFTTAGGTVVAACTGSRIGVESITVRDGWRFEDERESRKLEIHFSRSGSGGEDQVQTAGLAAAAAADDDGEVELKIECVDGVPTRTDDD